MKKNKVFIIEAIALAIAVAGGLIIWVNFTLHKRKLLNQPVSAYQSMKSIDLSGVPDNEFFSEEIDCVYVDHLGITNVSFKQKFSNQ
jgi:hypothetical protein